MKVIELLGRAGEGLEAGRGDLVLHLGIVDDLAQLGVEPSDDVGGVLAGSEEPRPRVHVETRDAGLVQRG